jgi:hypothetical protein
VVWFFWLDQDWIRALLIHQISDDNHCWINQQSTANATGRYTYIRDSVTTNIYFQLARHLAIFANYLFSICSSLTLTLTLTGR